DARGRLLRRTIIRYINLAYILCMTRICSRVKKRFPSLQHFVDAGILEEKEKEILQEMNRETHVKYWVPLVWSTAVVQLAFKEKRVESPLHHQNIIKSLGDFRTKLAELLGFDRMSFPLLYSQVVTISVYAYFAACLFGHQWLDPSLKYPRKEIDLYFPFFTSLQKKILIQNAKAKKLIGRRLRLVQFFVYMGWLRVAEVMINPFGEDDDDFEMNILIDRNLKTTYLIVDEMHGKHPELVHDAYWDTPVPKELPHTAASQAIVEPTPLEDGSTAQMNLNRQPNMLRRALSRLSTRSISSVRPGGEVSGNQRLTSKAEADTAFSTDSPAMTRARFGASTRSSSSRQSGTSVLGSMIRQGVNKFSTKRKRLDDEASIGDPNGPPSLTRSASNESENTLTPAADDGGFQGTPLVTIEEANERTITSIKDLEELSKRLEGVASSTDASEESNTTSSTVDASKMQEAEVTEAEPGRQRDTIKEEDEPESPA
ncbi:unnamed protein product, partial [Cyprideis torosa]